MYQDLLQNFRELFIARTVTGDRQHDERIVQLAKDICDAREHDVFGAAGLPGLSMMSQAAIDVVVTSRAEAGCGFN